ncbi:MAG: hydroxyisourate hydrolase [Nocardioidaceae bacterium]
MTTLSTHVLDAAAGRPAAELAVALVGPGVTASASTDQDGRIRWEGDLPEGTYALRFETGTWFEAAGRPTFYPQVDLTVTVAGEHVHVALLLSPFAYTTYKGS